MRLARTWATVYENWFYLSDADSAPWNWRWFTQMLQHHLFTSIFFLKLNNTVRSPKSFLHACVGLLSVLENIQLHFFQCLFQLRALGKGEMIVGWQYFGWTVPSLRFKGITSHPMSLRTQGGHVLSVTSDWTWCQQNTCSWKPSGSAGFREDPQLRVQISEHLWILFYLESEDSLS